MAVLGFYVAWRIWHLGQTLAQVADRLGNWEQQAHQAFQAERAPILILRGRQGTAQFRQQYAHLQGQLQQIRQLIYLVGLVPLLTRPLRRGSCFRSTVSGQRHAMRRH